MSSSKSDAIAIRNFLYLDSDKLRSFSSQLFEGVTESVLKRETETSGKADSQKGPFASGQVLADIFREGRSTTELRFLEDHAYSLFERRIEDLGLRTIEDHCGADNLGSSGFVRVKGNLKIDDTKTTVDLLANFNALGTALYRTIHNNDLQAKSLGKPIADKDIERLAKAENMYLDPKFLASASEVLNWSFKGMLEFQINQSGRMFSAPAKRDHLREPEELTIQKYSRLSEAEFTMVGIITQTGQPKTASIEGLNDSSNLKHALRQMSEHMRALEDSFSGVGNDEVVLDPIAVYQTLRY